MTDQGTDIRRNGTYSRTAPKRTDGAYAWYALGVMVLVYILNFVDRQILSILAEEIKADLGLDDAQLGFLYGTAFGIFYALFGIPLGRLADVWYRGRLMAIGLFTWSAMTSLSGLSSSYTQLAAARVGVGIGEASASPAAFSMLAGYFPKERRALAASIYSAGLYIGSGLSLVLGGAITGAWNRAYPAGDAPLGLAGWQAAFIAVGLPGLLLGAWVWTLREPPRSGPRGEPEPPAKPGAWRMFLRELAAIIPPFTLVSATRRGELSKNLATAALVVGVTTIMIALTGDYAQWIAYGIGCYAVASWAQALRFNDPPTYALTWGTPSIYLCLMGMGGLAVLTYGVTFWTAPFAIRTFGLSPQEAGMALGIPSAIASGIGVIVGGRLSDAWKCRDPRGRLFLCMASAATSIPALILMFTRPDLQTYLLLNPLVAMLSSSWVGSTVAAYQDFVLPRMHGTVSAIYLLGSTMIGLGLGPYASGKVATASGSLQLGVLCLLLAPAITLLCLWLASRQMRDVEATKVERAMRAGESDRDVRSGSHACA